MFRRIRWFALLLALGASGQSVSAEALRFHFVPVDACGTMTQVPVGPNGAMGELRRGLGARPVASPYLVRPNQLVTFRHPFTGRNATVPIRLPYGPPRMEHGSDRIIYNYGDYIVEARFLRNGAIDIVYNSGFLRPLQFD